MTITKDETRGIHKVHALFGLTIIMLCDLTVGSHDWVSSLGGKKPFIVTSMG